MAAMTVQGPVSTGDVVAKWEVPLSDGVYTVEFEHGTATGMRGIFINGKCIRRAEFKFALIGEEHFKVGSVSCTVEIRAINNMEYGYSLFVNGRPFDKFLADQVKQLKCWVLQVDGKPARLVLRLDTMEVFSDGKQLECTGEFTDEGSETHFELQGTPCFVRVSSSGRSRIGLRYELYHGNTLVPEAAVDQLKTWDAYW